MQKRSLSIRAFDCFRPQRAVDDFIRWSTNPKETGQKAEYFPMLEKRTLFENGYIASKSSHSRGSTIDLTIIATDVDLARAHVPGSIMPSGDVDMGTAFDWFGPESHIQSTDQPPDVRANRLWLKDLMWDVGFTDYPAEWWHFTMVEEPFPDTYFDFPVAYPPPRANSVKKLLPSLLHDRDLRGIDHSSQGDLWEGSAHAT